MCMILSNKETDFYIFKQVTHNLFSQVDASFKVDFNTVGDSTAWNRYYLFYKSLSQSRRNIIYITW